MHFALIGNIRIEAKHGLKGLCPGCSQPVFAKCGPERIWHWTHYKGKLCDKWWEPETKWHRSWKNNYPADWQEVFLPNEQTGEKHMADVRTAHNLVIEFQHSHIDPTERISREKFYQDMVWVVDGTRLIRDYSRFLKGKNHSHSIKHGVFRVDDAEEYFPVAWIESTVPVIFDFQGVEEIVDTADLKNHLYCLFPVQIGKSNFLAEIQRKTFINTTINGEWIIRARHFMDYLSQVKNEWQVQKEKRQRIQDNINFERFSRAMRYQQSRRRF